MRRIVLIGALIVLLAGAGTGIALAVRGGAELSPATARMQAAQVVRQWRAELRAGARAEPSRRFPNPPRRWLEDKLADAQLLCGCFTVVKTEFLHPLQTAPLVVVEAKDESRFFADHTAILDLVDSYSPARTGKARWPYEGFLLEAVDRAGVPFLVSDDYLRSVPCCGGGAVWAPRFEQLVPHG